MIVGVDGCAAGWIVVALAADLTWNVGIFPTIEKVWEAHRAAQLILVDIPIGLSATGDRDCDRMARKMLGPKRGVSVFPVPCRPAVYAAGYEEACDINQAHTGKRLSKQTWAIVPKIREMDQFLRSRPEAQGIVREIHPEVCFCALNGGPMIHRKSTWEGFLERRAVLERYFTRVGELTAEGEKLLGRRIAAPDDLLDAAAAAITGLAGVAGLASLPDEPPMDEHGLPMEMLYRRLTERQP